jgi:hypothetical protein
MAQPTPLPMAIPDQTDRLKARQMLHTLMRQHFNKEDLRQLCFDIGVSFDNLDAEGGRDSYITALLLYSFRTGTTGRLLQRLGELRPAAGWPAAERLRLEAIEAGKD